MWDRVSKKNKREISKQTTTCDLPELKWEKIIIDEKIPLQDWCSLFNCESEDLLKAIHVMGNSVQTVNDYLILNRQKKS